MASSPKGVFKRLGVCQEMKPSIVYLYLDGYNTDPAQLSGGGKVYFSAFVFTNWTYKNKQDLAKVKCYLESYGVQDEIPQKSLVFFSFTES